MKKALSIILAILMIVATVPVMSLATEKCTAHNYSWTVSDSGRGTIGTCTECQAKITSICLYEYQSLEITPDGYRISGGRFVPFTGKYVISGETRGSVIFNGGKYDVVFHNFTVENYSWSKGIGLNDATVNAVAYGINKFAGDNHAGLSGGGSTLNLTVAENSSASFYAISEYAEYLSVNPETTFNIISGTPSADMTDSSWRYNPLTVSKGTPASHEYTTEDGCVRTCCGYTFNLTHIGTATCTEKSKCYICEEFYYSQYNHKSWTDGKCVCGAECTHNDTDGNGFCDICGVFVGTELNLNEELALSTDSKEIFVKFVAPESKKYVFKAESEEVIEVAVLDESREYLYQDVTDKEILFAQEYEKDETYYFRFKAYNGLTATVNLTNYCEVHTGGEQTCSGYKCENCGDWYGEKGECYGTKQYCLGYLCDGCGQWFGEKGECYGTKQYCLGYFCEACGSWYGEKGDHLSYYDPDCSGYYCDLCGARYGEPEGEHILSDEPNCSGYFCSVCYRYFGEPSGEHCDEDNNGLCDVCEAFCGDDTVSVGDAFFVDREVFVKFIPAETGKYKIYSVSSVDPFLTVYNSNFFTIITDDDDDEHNINIYDFYCEYTFTKGETYYLQIKDYEHTFGFDVKIECVEHQSNAQTCMGFECTACGSWYGEADEEAHSFSTNVWDADIIRPVYNEETGEWSQGCYVFYCINGCGTTKTDPVNRADYTNYENILAAWEAVISRDDICENPRQGYTSSVTNVKAYIRNDYVEREQEELDARASAITSITADLKAGLENGSMKKADFTLFTSRLEEINELMGGDINNVIPSRVGSYYSPNAYYSGSVNNPNHSQNDYDRVMREYGFPEMLTTFIADLKDGSALKADYTAIDEAIVRIEEKLQAMTFNEAVTAEFEEIKAAVADAKLDVLTSKKDASTFEKALGDIEAGLDACIGGTHNYNSTVVKKATLTTDGEINCECPFCGKTETKTVAKVNDFSLSTVNYVYNGNNRTPKVTVKDADGNQLVKNVDYKTSIASSRSNIGKYYVKVTLIGNYEGTKNVYFYIRPGAASSLKATSTNTSVKLTWKKAAGAVGYSVYRYDKATDSYVKIKVTTALTYTDKDVKAGTKYTYKVVPYGRSRLNNVYYSKTASVIKTATQPVTPTKLTVKATTTTSVTLSWTKSAGATGYRVFRYDSVNKKWVQALRYTHSLSCTIEGLKPGTKYIFAVRPYISTGAVADGGSGTVWSPTYTKVTVTTKEELSSPGNWDPDMCPFCLRTDCVNNLYEYYCPMCKKTIPPDTCHPKEHFNAAYK